MNYLKEDHRIKYLFSGLDVNLPKKIIKPNDYEIIDYAELVHAQAKKEEEPLGLNDYIKKQKYPKEDVIVIVDLTDKIFKDNKYKKILNLKSLNFQGCLFYNTRFINCDLEGAIFRDTILNNVLFKKSNLNFTDFRGANLQSCNFDDSYLRQPWNNTKGLILSHTEYSARIFADIKNKAAKINERKRILDNKRLELEEISLTTPISLKILPCLGIKNKFSIYQKVRAELKAMEKGRFSKENIIHESFQNIFNPETFVFDPLYKKWAKPPAQLKKNKYLTLTKNDVLDYLHQTAPGDMSLNAFAKVNYIKSLPPRKIINKNIQIIADLSSKINIFGNNEWLRLNLHGMDFSGRDLTEVNFCGSDLSGCNFTDSNITYANFECCLLKGAIFKNTIAHNGNFINADLSESTIDSSIFLRAIFSSSFATNLLIEASDLSFTCLSNAIWAGSIIKNSQFDGSEIRKTNFSKSQFDIVSFKQSILNKANITSLNGMNCDFSNAVMYGVKAMKTEWKRSNFKNVQAGEVNFTGAIFSNNCSFENAYLRGSIFDDIKATDLNLKKARLDYAKLGYCQITDGNLIGASMKFAEMGSTTITDSNCTRLDMTGAHLFKAKFMNSCLINSSFYGAEITDSTLLESNFTNANWQNLHIKYSILDHIENSKTTINDNTEIIDCKVHDINDQFYHYGEDNFINQMFIEQQQSNQAKIQIAEKFKKLGFIFPIVYRLFRNKKYLTSSEAKKLCKVRRKNIIQLSNRLNEIKKTIKERSFTTLRYIENLIISHNI